MTFNPECYFIWHGDNNVWRLFLYVGTMGLCVASIATDGEIYEWDTDNSCGIVGNVCTAVAEIKKALRCEYEIPSIETT